MKFKAKSTDTIYRIFYVEGPDGKEAWSEAFDKAAEIYTSDIGEDDGSEVEIKLEELDEVSDAGNERSVDLVLESIGEH